MDKINGVFGGATFVFKRSLGLIKGEGKGAPMLYDAITQACTTCPARGTIATCKAK